MIQRSSGRACGLSVLAGLTIAASGGDPQWSATLGTPGFSGSYVAAFAAYDDGTGTSLYATGSFTANGVVGGQNLARWDGSAWQSVGGGLINQYSNCLAVYNGDLIAGGYFDSAGGVEGTAKLARWDGTQWHSMNAQSESFLNSVWDLQVWNGELYIAGNYLDLGGNPDLDHIAKWDGTNYSAVGGTIGGAVPLIILDLQLADLGDGEKLYAAGRFLNIGGVPANNIAVWNGSNWSALGGGITHTSIAQVICMTTFDDGNGPALYAGGSFTSAGGSPATRIAKWNGSSWSAMGDGFNNTVQELTVFDDGSGPALYAMGNFTLSGANPINRIAKWNGTSWEPVGVGADGNIYGAFVFDAGEGMGMHLGGGFNSAGGLAAARAASILAATPCIPDFTHDGVLDFFDVQAFLQAFSSHDPVADLTNDGTFDFFDVQAFLQAFSNGCP
ncbi:MAG: hypothetical protein KJZ65_12375 [Phycisphaerales bacterium]|nr:hypothetical protein [Phycisphaerales bacterium]